MANQLQGVKKNSSIKECLDAKSGKKYTRL